MKQSEYLVLTIGFVGQAMFFLRFFVQWLRSEQEKKSVIPEVFWYLSLAGGILMLVYAILKRDVVFIVGQSTGTFIYLRNIWYLRSSARQEYYAG